MDKGINNPLFVPHMKDYKKMYEQGILTNEQETFETRWENKTFC